ncbi:MAG: [Fe-Fe] hydrogenase large subunit C-terminal domain-containing protein [Sphaerochaetaceae bacterium]|jgi:iron only hydrogenase large subunit-like protein
MNEDRFYHTLRVVEELCIGCTHCMKNCPTEAIRIVGGKAVVNFERCVDCGQCMDVCPHSAIIIEQDDINQIFSYSHRVAIIPSLFLGQFEDDVSEKQILGALKEIGFTQVYLSEFGVDILRELGKSNISIYADEKPVVSSYCPSILRLIQIRYQNLLPNINLVRTPAQITALFAKEYLKSTGVKGDDIGIFYVTPCAAKYAQIKTPNSATSGLIQGGLNLDSLYNLIQKHIANNSIDTKDVFIPPVTSSSFLYSLTKGESSLTSGRSLAVDELHNVIEFLELVEDERHENIEFLELRACATGCTGGILTPRNRFLATERMKHNAAKLPRDLDEAVKEKIRELAPILVRDLKNERLEPKGSMQFDEDRKEAIKKMEKAKRIALVLPQIDCGLCGSPTCNALAEDIAKGNASIRRCLVLKVNDPAGLNHLARIWGEAVGKESNSAPVNSTEEAL